MNSKWKKTFVNFLMLPLLVGIVVLLFSFVFWFDPKISSASPGGRHGLFYSSPFEEISTILILIATIVCFVWWNIRLVKFIRLQPYSSVLFFTNIFILILPYISIPLYSISETFYTNIVDRIEFKHDLNSAIYRETNTQILDEIEGQLLSFTVIEDTIYLITGKKYKTSKQYILLKNEDLPCASKLIPVNFDHLHFYQLNNGEISKIVDPSTIVKERLKLKKKSAHYLYSNCTNSEKRMWAQSQDTTKVELAFIKGITMNNWNLVIKKTDTPFIRENAATKKTIAFPALHGFTGGVTRAPFLNADEDNGCLLICNPSNYKKFNPTKNFTYLAYVNDTSSIVNKFHPVKQKIIGCVKLKNTIYVLYNKRIIKFQL